MTVPLSQWILAGKFANEWWSPDELATKRQVIWDLVARHARRYQGSPLMAALDELWGAVLDQLDVDLTSQTVVLTARVTGGPGPVVHRLELRDVSQFRFHSSVPGPWDYAEITEAQVGRTNSGRLSVEFVLWSEDAGISVIAASAIFDGTPVE